MEEWKRKQQIKLTLATSPTEEGPKSLKDLSARLDQMLEEYNRWLVGEKKDSPLIPYEASAIKTFLLRHYMLS